MFPPKRTIVFGHASDPDQMVFDRDLAASADAIDTGRYPNPWEPTPDT